MISRDSITQVSVAFHFTKSSCDGTEPITIIKARPGVYLVPTAKVSPRARVAAPRCDPGCFASPRTLIRDGRRGGQGSFPAAVTEVPSSQLPPLCPPLPYAFSCGCRSLSIAIQEAALPLLHPSFARDSPEPCAVAPRGHPRSSALALPASTRRVARLSPAAAFAAWGQRLADLGPLDPRTSDLAFAFDF